MDRSKYDQSTLYEILKLIKKITLKIGTPICNSNILVTNPKEEKFFNCLRFFYGRTKFSG